MKCKYCEREVPNKEFLTDKGCKWCDVLMYSNNGYCNSCGYLRGAKGFGRDEYVVCGKGYLIGNFDFKDPEEGCLIIRPSECEEKETNNAE